MKIVLIDRLRREEKGRLIEEEAPEENNTEQLVGTCVARLAERINFSLQFSVLADASGRCRPIEESETSALVADDGRLCRSITHKSALKV